MQKTENNLSHAPSNTAFHELVEKIRSRILSRGDLYQAPVSAQLEVLDGLCSFPLGRFILERGGANGFWTDYMVAHPERQDDLSKMIPLERFFLTQCPIVVAHQERYQIFKRLVQEHLKDGQTIASIPCGLMRDLLSLDLSKTPHTHLVGIDIDPESLQLAAELAKEKGVTNASFIQGDAWKLSYDKEFDLISSSGLNVYESNPERVLELYRILHRALKDKGYLIMSVLTTPPDDNFEKTDWNIEGFSKEVLILDRILHRHVLDVKWKNFRSPQEIQAEFKKAGFSKISIFYDKNRVFPTVLAQK